MTKIVAIVVLTLLKLSGAVHVNEEKEELATLHTNNEKESYKSFEFAYGGTAMDLFGKIYPGAEKKALDALQADIKKDGATVTEVVDKQCGNGWKLADFKDTTAAMAAIAKVMAKTSNKTSEIKQQDIFKVFKGMEFYVKGQAAAGSGNAVSAGPKSFQFTFGGMFGMGKSKVCIEQPDGVVLSALKKLLNGGEDAMTALNKNLEKNKKGSVTAVEASQCGNGWTLSDNSVKTKTQNAVAKVLKNDKDLDQSQNNDPTKGLKFYVKG